MARIAELIAALPGIEYARPRPKHYLEYAALRFLSALWRLLPLGLSLRFGRILADAARLCMKRRNNQCMSDICEHLGLPADSAQARHILRASYRLLADNWVYLVNAGDIGSQYIKDNIVFHGMEEILDNEKNGRGCILAACHLGPWELMCRFFHLSNLPMATIVAVQHNPLSDRFINHHRSQGGFHKLVHNRLGVRHTLQYLKSGGRLVVIADVDVGDKGIFAPFMDKPASTPRGPAELALRTGARIHVGSVARESDGKFHVHIQPGINPHDYPGDREESVLAITSEMNRRISEQVRKHPEQWFWIQRRWKTRLP